MFKKVKNCIAPKEFYIKVFKVLLPVILQQLLVALYSVVDTIMVSNISRGVSGVGLATQISNFVIIIVFGICSGGAIFIAQFFGKKDEENMKKAFSLGLILIVLFTTISSIIISIFPHQLLSIFSSDEEVINAATTYLNIGIFTIIPHALTFYHAVAFRNVQKTKVTLIIALFTSITNVIFNYLLINGFYFIPKLGIQGAAIASFISMSLGFILYASYTIISKQPFCPNITSIINCFKPSFIKPFILKTIPLVINEALFALGSIIYVYYINNLCVAGNISNAYEGFRIAETTVNIVFTVGTSISICVQAMIGEVLGRKEFDKGEEYARYFMFIGLILSLFLGTLNFILAPILPNMFNCANKEIYDNAVNVIRVFSLRIVLRMFIVILYASFRAGGRSKFIMFLDSGLTWLVGVPLGAILVFVLKIDNVAIFYLLLQADAFLRVVIGLVYYFKKKWLNNITDEVMDKNNKKVLSN